MNVLLEFLANSLVGLLSGALTGGVVAAVMTLYFESRQKRRDEAINLAHAYLERYKDANRVVQLFNQDRERPNSWDSDELEFVRNFYNWVELMSLLICKKHADPILVKEIKLNEVIYYYHDIAAQISALKYDLANEWPYMVQYTKETRNVTK